MENILKFNLRIIIITQHSTFKLDVFILPYRSIYITENGNNLISVSSSLKFFVEYFFPCKFLTYLHNECSCGSLNKL